MTTLAICLPVDYLVTDPTGAAWEFLNAAELAGIQYWSQSLEASALWADKYSGVPYLATRLRTLAPRLEPRQGDQCEALATWLATQRKRKAKADKATKTKAVN